MQDRPAILLTGAAGQIGWELVRTLAPLGRVFAPIRAELDLSEPAAIRSMIREIQPVAVVNAAGYTAVDQAETEPDAARSINAVAPGVLTEEAAQVGAVIVHYSTDYVFDGAGSAPYREADTPNPQSVYGRTKLEGEQLVRSAAAAHLILRTSWVYGLRGHNFLRTMLRLARERDEIRVVDDQIGSPTWCRMIAEATAQMLGRLLADPGGATARFGTYHLTAAGTTTWYGFARELLSTDPARREQICRTLAPISTEQYPTPARRPPYSVLDNSLVAERFGIRLPHWTEQLHLTLEAECAS